MPETLQRCQWCTADPYYIAYHDKEWGVPVYRPQKLFEMLVLEGMQAGLSWITILQKRRHLRQAFANFNARKLVEFTNKDVQRLMKNPHIIRNRLKITSVVSNAHAYLALVDKKVSVSDFFWQFTDGKVVHNKWRKHEQIPASTERSSAMAKELKRHGFKFVGPTICYAFMQAVGMVNDHLQSCFRYKEIKNI